MGSDRRKYRGVIGGLLALALTSCASSSAGSLVGLSVAAGEVVDYWQARRLKAFQPIFRLSHVCKSRYVWAHDAHPVRCAYPLQCNLESIAVYPGIGYLRICRAHVAPEHGVLLCEAAEPHEVLWVCGLP